MKTTALLKEYAETRSDVAFELLYQKFAELGRLFVKSKLVPDLRDRIEHLPIVDSAILNAFDYEPSNGGQFRAILYAILRNKIASAVTAEIRHSQVFKSSNCLDCAAAERDSINEEEKTILYDLAQSIFSIVEEIVADEKHDVKAIISELYFLRGLPLSQITELTSRQMRIVQIHVREGRVRVIRQLLQRKIIERHEIPKDLASEFDFGPRDVD